MDSLFENLPANTQPLRKLEPLIRFDVDGNPQPRKPLDQSPNFDSPPKKVEPKREEPPVSKPQEDLKRKVIDPPPAGVEPKKKQQKQASIMNFFTKKT